MHIHSLYLSLFHKYTKHTCIDPLSPTCTSIHNTLHYTHTLQVFEDHHCQKSPSMYVCVKCCISLSLSLALHIAIQTLSYVHECLTTPLMYFTLSLSFSLMHIHAPHLGHECRGKESWYSQFFSEFHLSAPSSPLFCGVQLFDYCTQTLRDVPWTHVYSRT